ncbi:hypothetical protein AMATHDRAFT_6153 [Amanita thiersii Skay4041]|uniref:F-box domain-containing protein n=1 Tax=Amanita thiersii Skay4041 TaxID=703135 RepID=A0A2A9NJX3_9AGAR|nr:hypothetical protein AMATHDRAFT_6153 [Amanita thiersii Skay4041]
MSIMQSAPVELIHETLSHFIATIHAHDPAPFPWFLGHICRSWRYAFFSMRPFWSKIDIDMGKLLLLSAETADKTPSLTHYDRTCDVVKFYLDIHWDKPLCFHFAMGGNHTAQELACITRLLLMLAGNSKRWQDATLTLVPEQFRSIFQISREGSLPLLTTLNVGVPSENLIAAWDHSHELASLFVNAPRLTEIELCNRVPWNISWSSITKLHLHDVIGSMDVVEILRQTTNLELLHIQNSNTYELPTPAPRGDTTSRTPVLLPKLKVLATCGYSILMHLKAPVLESVYTLGSFKLGEQVPSLLIRSSCRPKELMLLACRAIDAWEVLLSAPTITHLAFGNIDDLGCILRLLVENSHVLPQLRMLVTNTNMTLNDITDLSTFLSTWTKGVSGDSRFYRVRCVYPPKSLGDQVDTVVEDVSSELDNLKRHWEAKGVGFDVGPPSTWNQDEQDWR